MAEGKLAEFFSAPASVQVAFMQQVKDEAEADHDFEEYLREIDEPGPAPRQPDTRLRDMPIWDEHWSRRARAIERVGHLEGHPGREAFLAIPARDYIPALTGELADKSPISCPLPEHEDSTASCEVYRDDRGWWCFGCNRGGDIFTLAALLWDLDSKGPSFDEICRRLAEVFA